MKFERTPNIPAIAGDGDRWSIGRAYGAACLQFLESSLKFDICELNFLSIPNCFSNVKFC